MSIFFSILVFFGIFFSSCASKYQKEKIPIYDIQHLRQIPYIYTRKIQGISYKKQRYLKNELLWQYFHPWNIKRSTYTLKEATWGNVYSHMNVYSENLRPISKEWFKKVIRNANYSKFNTLKKKAITINDSYLKVFPSIEKIFLDPKKDGEGFPFDYNQNSAIKINTPVFITHLSKDKLWAFVESSVALGWVPMKDLAYVNSKFIKSFENKDYYICLKDNTKIYKNGYLQSSVSMGTILPRAKYHRGFIVAGKNYKNKAYVKIIDFSKNFKKLGIKFDYSNIRKISNQLIGRKYGWGGILGNRDCSSTMKDFFAPFGIFLPRNSKSQKNIGKVYDVSHLSNEEKSKFILKHAIPFKTLVYLKGHIMLYVGSKNSEPLVMHDMWGVKLLKNGKVFRKIVGKTVVSTLHPGSELDNYYNKDSILSKVLSINIVDE